MDKQKSLEKLNAFGQGTMMEHIGIEITDFEKDYICGKMPVDNRTVQPYGLLHGGASAAFAETLGSIAGGMQIDLNDKGVVGIELSCNHLRSVKNGWVYGKATPIKIGRKIHVWNIEIKNEDDNLVCVSRLTLAVISKK